MGGICPSCGKPLGAGAMVCASCGAIAARRTVPLDAALTGVLTGLAVAGAMAFLAFAALRRGDLLPVQERGHACEPTSALLVAASDVLILIGLGLLIPPFRARFFPRTPSRRAEVFAVSLAAGILIPLGPLAAQWATAAYDLACLPK